MTPTQARRAAAAESVVERFFAELAGPQPLLGNRSGTLRFEITDDGDVTYTYVSIDRGTIEVSRKKGRADAVLRIDRALAADLVTGRANAMAAVLRGVVDPEGDLGLLIAFQRLFPGPPPKRARSGRGR